MRREVGMAVILLLSTLVVVPQVEAGGLGSEDPASVILLHGEWVTSGFMLALSTPLF